LLLNNVFCMLRKIKIVIDGVLDNKWRVLWVQRVSRLQKVDLNGEPKSRILTDSNHSHGGKLRICNSDVMESLRFLQVSEWDLFGSIDLNQRDMPDRLRAPSSLRSLKCFNSNGMWSWATHSRVVTRASTSSLVACTGSGLSSTPNCNGFPRTGQRLFSIKTV